VTLPIDSAERTNTLTDGFTHEPLRERVAVVLREAILDGALPPGTALIEKVIAEDLQISRAPVREAIRMLSQEGLVESVPYKGSHVRRLSARDVTEVYSMRGLLERFAARRVLEAAGAASPAGAGDALAPLRAACDAMQRCAEADDLKGLSAADERFHRALIDLAGHALLFDMWSLIGLRARHVMGLRNAQLRAPLRVVANHREILQALTEGDLERSLALITAHIDAGAQLILDDWQDGA
jgi:DNA-binding GntR family transcriptional regulator